MRATPPSTWPFVGRQIELETIRDHLARPAVTAVVVTAPAGAGKTRLAREVIAGSATPARWWQASPAASSVPLGALVTGETAAAAAAAEGELPTHGLVVVDDAPHLDARTSDLLARRVADGSTRVLATARTGVPIPDHLEWLWLGEGTRHHELAPLTTDDLDRLVAVVLGLEPAARGAAVATLAERTRSNALFVRELLLQAAARPPDRELDLGADAPPHLLRVLQARLDATGPGARRALRCTAVLGRLPLDVAVDEAGAAAIEEAEVEGFLTVDDGDPAHPEVVPSHPLYAEAALASMGVAAQRAEAERVARALLASPSATATDRLRAVVALVDAGREVAGDDLAAGAQAAFAVLDHRLAIRLAEHAVGADAGFEALLVLGAARSGAGDTDEADRVLALALEAAADDDQRARATGRLSVHYVANGHRVDQAAALIDDVAAQLVDERARAFLRAERAKLASIRGEAEPSPADADDELGRLNAAIVGAYSLAVAGDTVASRATVAEALHLAERHRTSLPWASELVRFSTVFAALVAEGPSQARTTAEEGLARAAGSSPSTAPTWRYLAGFTAVAAGALADGAASLQAAARELAGHDLIGARPLAVAAAAWAAAQRGDVAEARHLLDASVDAAEVDARVRIQVAIADAWCDAVEGTLEAAVAKATAASLAAADIGQRVPALLVLHDLVRLGHARQVRAPIERLVGEGPPSWLASFVAARAAASAERSPGRLADLADAVAPRWPLAAAELHAERARIARRERDDVTASRADLAAVQAATGLDRRCWTLRDLASPLTRREAEVARAIAAGATNREAAEAAGVSIRTVENQLQSTYRKLGIGRRDELRQLLAPTGAAPDVD